MRKSIQIKLLFYMIINILVFAALLYGSNYFFANSYHVNHKKNLLIGGGQKINELVGSHEATELDGETQLILNRLERSLGASINIGNQNGTIYFPNPDVNTHRKNSQGMNPFFQRDPLNNLNQLILQNSNGNKNSIIKEWDQYDENSIFVQVEDPNLGIDTLRYQTTLDNGLLLMIWIPMSEIADSISLTNRFTSIIGLITIFITGIWSFFISRRFTNPIKNMNRIAKEMSKLNFSQTLAIQGQDEIAQLSQTINDLSNKLSYTITELNTKNQQLEQDIHRERRLDKMRKEFISNVSHELKTPIFLIQGYAEGLKKNIATNPEKREFYTDVIIEESEKMDIIVRDLLDLSQMESGTFSVSKCTFDLFALTHDITQKIEPILNEKDIQLKMDLNNSIEVIADPVRIEQVIVNYINNGINHINESKELEITIQDLGNKIRLSVFNSGEQIPADAINKIWNSFYKVDQSRTREYGGTGLGLSIVKSILDAHQNNYGVNNLENGVEFWFELNKFVH